MKRFGFFKEWRLFGLRGDISLFWAWKPDLDVIRIADLSFRTNHRSLMLRIHEAGEGFEIPMHTDGTDRIDRPIHSIWILLRKPREGGDLVTIPPSQGRWRYFDGGQPHGVNLVKAGRRMIFIGQLFHYT